MFPFCYPVGSWLWINVSKNKFNKQKQILIKNIWVYKKSFVELRETFVELRVIYK